MKYKIIVKDLYGNILSEFITKYKYIAIIIYYFNILTNIHYDIITNLIEIK